ncbi:tRNase Z TRZ1-like [Dendrobium catenatum]|uniref:tRNase Z TRZ1-like n=1 Tax=Dendrobium catenatum TaxID=906689 RepID=UPI0010A0B488|nr:tRNase Z TRZ1-like [Dendrobium catenatum]
MEHQKSKEISEILASESSTTMGRQGTTKGEELSNKSSPSKGNLGLLVEGYPVEGLSIGGQETCVIFPSLRIAFDIGRCPQRAISQEYLFISHGHLDHIVSINYAGSYFRTTGSKEGKLDGPAALFFQRRLELGVKRKIGSESGLGGSIRLKTEGWDSDLEEMECGLQGLEGWSFDRIQSRKSEEIRGDEFQIRKDLKVKAFRTYHVIPSQGYIIYSVKQKLKQEYMTLSGHEIKSLRLSGVEVTYTVTSPEIAFTGDTMSDFVVDPNNADVLKARILVMESTFVDNAMSIEHAREYGHTHMSEIASYAEKYQNKAIVLIHFSARYTSEVKLTVFS